MPGKRRRRCSTSRSRESGLHRVYGRADLRNVASAGPAAAAWHAAGGAPAGERDLQGRVERRGGLRHPRARVGRVMRRAPPRVSLERLSAHHIPDLEALIDDAAVRRFTRVPEPVPADFVQTWLARYEAGQHDGTCAGFAARDEAGRFVGVGARAGHRRRQRRDRARVRRRDRRPRARRRERDPASAHRLGAGARPAPSGSSSSSTSRTSPRVASPARAGYVREGVMRSYFVTPGVRRDSELWSRLPGDGPVRGGAETSRQLHRHDLVRPVRHEHDVAVDLERLAVVLEDVRAPRRRERRGDAEARARRARRAPRTGAARARRSPRRA